MTLQTHTFHFSKITNTARQGKLRPPVELTQFSDKNLCVCRHMDVYLERTKAWKKHEGQLLLSFINVSPPRQFPDGLLFFHYLELALRFLRPIQQD